MHVVKSNRTETHANRSSIKKNGRILRTVPLLKKPKLPSHGFTTKVPHREGNVRRDTYSFSTRIKKGQSSAADCPLQRARGCFALLSTWRRSMQASVVTSAYFYKKKPPCPGATYCMRHQVIQTGCLTIKAKGRSIIRANCTFWLSSCCQMV